MARKLDGKKVAILVADGFEQVEMTKPREALDEAGAQTKIVSLKAGKIQGMNHADKGDKFDVDLTVDQARPEQFDALMIPGGLFNPDVMTSWPGIRVDMRNAGARWVDEEVVVDNGLVSSRKPDDIPAFNRKMIKEFAEGPHKSVVAA